MEYTEDSGGENEDKYRDVGFGGAKLSQGEFYQLLSSLPNLRKRDITHSSFSQSYLEYLQHIDSSRHLTYIEEIVTNYDQDDAYEEFSIWLSRLV